MKMRSAVVNRTASPVLLPVKLVARRTNVNESDSIVGDEMGNLRRDR